MSELILYAIADALQIPLIRKDGVISGKRDLMLDFGFGLRARVQLAARAIFVTPDQAAVYAHVCGNLRLLVTYNMVSGKGTLSLYVVEASTPSIDDTIIKAVNTADSIRTMVSDISPHIKKMFVKMSGGVWKPYKLPF
jgi:hypothetical protein